MSPGNRPSPPRLGPNQSSRPTAATIRPVTKRTLPISFMRPGQLLRTEPLMQVAAVTGQLSADERPGLVLNPAISYRDNGICSRWRGTPRIVLDVQSGQQKVQR